MVSAYREDWIVAAGSCVGSAGWEHWTAAIDSYVVFATGLNR